MDGFTARAGNAIPGCIHVILRGQGLLELIAAAQLLDLFGIQIPSPGYVVEQMLQQSVGCWLSEDIGMFVYKTTDFAVEVPQQGFDRCVDRISPGLECFYEGRCGFPEFPSGRFLAQANQSMNDFLQVNKLGVQVIFANDAGEGKLVHLAQLADMAEYGWILQALRNAACDLHA